MSDSPVKDAASGLPVIAPAGPTRQPAAVESAPEVYFRKGFGLKAEVQEELATDYNGRLVDLLREREFALTAGDVTVRLAREFGFCYGVERAVDYAYQTRRKFPDRRVFLAGEIIHNPHVNAKLREMGVEILNPTAPGAGIDYGEVRSEDVVILPAFGVTIEDFETLRGIGCVMVDTTCGSVLNVWKRVESYSREGYTSLIHGKYYHEETRATASQTAKHGPGHYIIVRNMDEARVVCSFLEGKISADALMSQFGHAVSPGFEPERDLKRIGVANQTTERQGAVVELLRDPLDVMVVIGGFNSSNTLSLAALCSESVRTYHVEDAAAIDPSAGTIRHRPLGSKFEIETEEWLAADGPVRVGVTAGASTPNNKIGDAVARIFGTRGISGEDIV